MVQRRTSVSISIVLALAVVAMPIVAMAQAPAPVPAVRLRGTIDTVSANTLSMTTREGEHYTMPIPADVRVQAFDAIKLSDIKPGDFVGSTAVRGPDGKLKALEVHVLPAAQRGANDGARPYDLAPESTMNNGTVAGLATGTSEGPSIKLNFQNGNSVEISVPSGIPVTAFATGDRSLLKPGAAVTVTARKQPDGSYTMGGISAEKDGVKPPF